MEDITTHIHYNKTKLDDPTISSQSRRHYEEELNSLEQYRNKHPENSHDPSPLELFCDANPSALECKIYES
jgi:hypothetical protein